MKKFIFIVFALWLVSIGVSATELIPFEPKGPYPSTGVQAGALDIAWTPMAATTLSVTFTVQGRELLLVHNPATSSATFTIVSVTDAYGMKGDISSYAVASASVCAFWFGKKKGWDAGDGVTINSATSGLQLAVARINQVFNPVDSVTTASRFRVSTVRGPYPTSTQVSGGQLELMQTAAGSISRATIPITGHELLIWKNTDSSPHKLRLIGSHTDMNRVLYLPSSTAYYSIGAGKFSCWLMSTPVGWVNSDGHVRAYCDSALVRIMIAKIPIR